MNNKEKYKNTIDKIEIRDEAINEAIKNARKYSNERMIKMTKKNKFRMFRQAIITIATLLGLTAASYAGYVAYNNISGTMTYKNTTKINFEGIDEIISTIEHAGIENNGIKYNIETPAEIEVIHDGAVDRYQVIIDKSASPNYSNLPDVYMEIQVLDASAREAVEEANADLMEYYSKNSYSSAEKVTIGKENYEATRYYYAKGMKWDSECHVVYVVDINDEKFMVIDIQYFIEATEGWATRYVQLLKTLEIYE